MISRLLCYHVFFKLDLYGYPHRNFSVLAPDTHGLDSDGDGLGCEDSSVAYVNSSVTNKSSNLNTTLP
ncbi:MAG TPA: hypothetical protein VFU67_07505 [Nitrososphaeraceae archaeon]|nr:hypothetical protein [Nitrososphaeraceae archaeon]